MMMLLGQEGIHAKQQADAHRAQAPELKWVARYPWMYVAAICQEPLTPTFS